MVAAGEEQMLYRRALIALGATQAVVFATPATFKFGPYQMSKDFGIDIT